MARLLYLVAMTAMFVGVGILAYNAMPAPRPVGSRGLPRRRTDLSRIPSTLFRVSYWIVNPLAPLARVIPWRSYRSHSTIALRRAGLGDVFTPDHLLVMKAFSALIVPFLLSRIFALFTNPLMYVLASLGGFMLPDKLVADMRKARERQIVRALPGAVDVLSLSVEAGLEFLTAMQRLVERGGLGPLRDELATILSDIRLGKSRAEAMKAFATRVEIPEVGSFVSVLVQADALGSSIGPVLQQQAERMRVERFQRAEKAGAAATQKILFPLVLFIFPAVLIVVLGPVALQFIYGGGNR